jgi:ABC-type phosphate/phosphonate transport system permease subunit
MHEEPSALLAAAILFIGILIAVPFSALAQQQQSPQYDSRMEKDNKALVRSFVEEEVFNDHIIEVR